MDNDFMEKWNAICAWEKADEDAEQAEGEISFSREIDGLVKISTKKGSFTYQLKSLSDLYAQKTSASINAENALGLLYAIESPIRRYYESHPELTDSSVIFALEALSAKPEIDSDDELVTTIVHELRLQLSMSDRSRDEVKQALRKVLNSAKKHNRDSGRKGYVNFIMEYVP